MDLIGQALHLADLIDVAKEELGAYPDLGSALARARELAPKPLEGMEAWRNVGKGVGFTLDDAKLCRALANQCSDRPLSEPGRCACAPAPRGKLEFSFELDS